MVGQGIIISRQEMCENARALIWELAIWKLNEAAAVISAQAME